VIWATLLYSVFPGAAFCFAAYPTAMMNLMTIFAFNDYVKGQRWRAAFWAGLATSSGALMVAIGMSFFLSGAMDLWKLRKAGTRAIPLGPWAVLTLQGLVSLWGILAFMAYEQIRFRDAIAFIHVQRAWYSPIYFQRAKAVIAGHSAGIAVGARAASAVPAHVEFLWYNLLNVAVILGLPLFIWAGRRILPRVLTLLSCLMWGIYLYFVVSGIQLTTSSRLSYGAIPVFCAMALSLQKGPSSDARWRHRSRGPWDFRLHSLSPATG